MKCSPGSFWAVEGLVAVPLVLCALAAWRVPAMWLPVLSLLVVGALLGAWLCAFRIEVRDGVLTYRSLLGGQRRVPLDEIGAAVVEFGCTRYADLFRPTFRLVIRPKPAAGWAPFDINLKVFKRNEITELLQVVGTN